MFVRFDFSVAQLIRPRGQRRRCFDARRITRDRSDHSVEPRSRLVNISSHVGSMRIGVPHIRIEDGPRVLGGTVS
jgi:hypothetical protein